MLKINTKEQYCEIVDEFADLVYRVAFQYFLNKYDAEDVVQDVFEKLLTNKEKSFADKAHVKAWLVRITINRCLDIKKSAHVQNEVALDGHDIAVNDEMQELAEVIKLLDETDRNIIFLYYYEGYTIKEIAKMLNEKQNTVNSRLTRARKKLREILQEEEAI